MPKLPRYYGNTKAVDAVLKAFFGELQLRKNISGGFQNVTMSFCSLKSWDSFLQQMGLDHMRPN